MPSRRQRLWQVPTMVNAGSWKFDMVRGAQLRTATVEPLR